MEFFKKRRCFFIFICSSEKNPDNGTVEKSGWEMLIATFSHMKNTYQILLIPLTLFTGIQSAFLTADFTEVLELI